MPDAADFSVTPEKARLAANFNAAAVGYDDTAALQKTVTRELLERLEVMNIQPRLVLDLGSGTGGAARDLAVRYRKSRVVQVDLALGMLQYARGQSRRWFSRQSFLCADADSLPIRGASVDLVFSSLMLQWCDDLDRVFGQVRRAMRGGGLFLFATVGPDTLYELRDSWAEAGDDEVVHVNLFRDMHDIGDALMRAGFADPVMETDTMILTYARVQDLLRELKQLGARNINRGRRRSLTGKHRLANMIQAYEHRRIDGGIPATYEVVYGHAWMPEGPVAAAPRDGVATIPVDSIKKRRTSS